MADLRGRIVLVTGASAGAGPHIAARFASAGAWVGVNFRRDLAGAKRLADDLRSAGGRALLLPGDVADPAQAWAVVERLDLQWGPPDVVVAQSGSENRPGADCWPPAIYTAATLEIARAAWPSLRRSAGGRLLLLGPAVPELAAVADRVRGIVAPVVTRAVAVAPGTTFDVAADAVYRLAQGE
jgi:3-oxoacyl-[acyl-carrier protein] reductase